jgi:two-component system response regulator PhoP
MRILIVEDESRLREQLVSKFRHNGYALDSADNGEDGLYYGLEYPIDLAIIDLGLPKLSGIEIIEKIRDAGKTYPILILTARSRRSAGHAAPTLENGAIKLDTRTQDVFVNDDRLDLTAFEYRLLHYLMMNAGKVVSKMELTEHLYEEDADRDSNVIEVFVGRLRKKIDPANCLQPIETLRGRGYRFITVP